MTSLELVRHPIPPDAVPPAWGTGKTTPYEGKDLWVPRAPTWQTTGESNEHNYSSTALKLSNVRDNDELVPRPQDIYINDKFINKPFPAEHPYSSHMEKFAMIPKFDSPQDPQRGVSARHMKPIPSEMPANAYDVTIVKKIKGFPYRHEIQALPSEGQKTALYWQGENHFDQQSKIHGNHQQFFPIPPKQMAPNLQYRHPDLQVSARSQNVLRNIERNQWIPSQKLDYTGLGPANPMALDNIDGKRFNLLNTGTPDDSLYPRSINTFDPSRPMEGRTRKMFAPKAEQLAMVESGTSNNLDYKRKMTLTEREEDRLLNGKQYVNLPQDTSDPKKDTRWQSLDQSFRPEPNLERLYQAQLESTDDSKTDEEKNEEKENYLRDQKVDRERRIQGMEAQNRWKVLEDSNPAHDIAQIKEKYKLLKDKEMPSTFYRHEGKYNEERAGMYKTSYDPQRLAYSMNAQRLSGGELFNTSQSHVEASRYPTITWDENEAALNGSHTVVFKNNELSGDRPSTNDMLDPYRGTVAMQREMLQPSVLNARPHIQEGGVVLKEDIYGDCYNTTKFLQENKLDRNIRIEPTDLISHQNQNLERVRERVATRDKPKQPGKMKSVHFSDNVQINNVHQNFPVQILKDSHTEPLSCVERETLAVEFGNHTPTSLNAIQTHPPLDKSSSFMTSTVAGNDRDKAIVRVPVPTVVTRNKDPVLRPPAISFSRDPQRKPSPLSETVDEFRSLSTNFMPTGLDCQQSLNTSYSMQFPIHNLAEKKDLRFSWTPGKGQPRPQTCLLELQDGFIKSEVRKRFHRMYPEINPEIRMNINTGKKHSFFGINAQVIHG